MLNHHVCVIEHRGRTYLAIELEREDIPAMSLINSRGGVDGAIPHTGDGGVGDAYTDIMQTVAANYVPDPAFPDADNYDFYEPVFEDEE
jgi:hypothetical protein